MREILIPVGLVLLGIVFVASEAFIPSAGLLGILAAASLLGGIVMAYYYNGAFFGTVFMVATGAIVSFLIARMVKWWPTSAIGKKILVEPPKEEDLLVDRSGIESMVGRVGKTLGLMVPGGLVEIDGKRFDAIAEVAIEPDTYVQVRRISNGRILQVHPVDAETALKAQRDSQNDDGEPGDTLEDAFSDPFADPLG